MTRYLAAEEVLVIHALVVEETTGSHGVREPGLLESIVMRPQAQFGGREVHVDVFAKAAALGEALVNYHVFVDGNKRTGLVATARFLALNGYELNCSQEEAEETILGVATKDVDLDTFATWLKRCCQRQT